MPEKEVTVKVNELLDAFLEGAANATTRAFIEQSTSRVPTLLDQVGAKLSAGASDRDAEVQELYRQIECLQAITDLGIKLMSSQRKRRPG